LPREVNVPGTALGHFQQDIGRARAIVAHADPLPQGTAAQQLLRGDLLRSAWMFGVGALDAYFCDAYTDIVAATIIAKSRHAVLVLLEFFHDIRFPVRAILEPYANNLNWRWRMAARKMMERENVLSLATIWTLFNKFFRTGINRGPDRMAGPCCFDLGRPLAQGSSGPLGFGPSVRADWNANCAVPMAKAATAVATPRLRDAPKAAATSIPGTAAVPVMQMAIRTQSGTEGGMGCINCLPSGRSLSVRRRRSQWPAARPARGHRPLPQFSPAAPGVS
jgi:hypothetical protein